MRQYLLLLSLVLIGCKGPESSTTTDSAIDQLVYKFHDSSVAPQYHRSYEITITADKIKKRIHSYGETISEKEHTCTSADFKAVQAAFKSGKIRNCKREKNEGCTGGTGVSILTSKAGANVFDGYRSDCGGTQSGTMCGDTDAVLKALNLILEK